MKGYKTKKGQQNGYFLGRKLHKVAFELFCWFELSLFNKNIKFEIYNLLAWSVLLSQHLMQAEANQEIPLEVKV